MVTECGDYDHFCTAGNEFTECFWEGKIPADEQADRAEGGMDYGVRGMGA